MIWRKKRRILNKDQYFGELENGNLELENFPNHGLKVQSQIIEKHGKEEVTVRRSRRQILRHSFTDANDNGMMGENQDDDEFRLIK